MPTEHKESKMSVLLKRTRLARRKVQVCTVLHQHHISSSSLDPASHGAPIDLYCIFWIVPYHRFKYMYIVAYKL